MVFWRRALGAGRGQRLAITVLFPSSLLPFGSLLGAALHWEPPLVSVLPSWLTSAQSWQGLKALRILGLNLSPIPIVTVSKLFNPFSLASISIKS